MEWKIEFVPAAARELRKAGAEASRRILKFLSERVARQKNPRRLGTALRGSELGEFWKYRIGDYRVIAHIQDKALLVLVVRVGHRREVYR